MKAKANIPEGLTREHQQEIEGILGGILIQLEPHGAQQIVVCLNETKEEGPAPRFVGYLLGKDMTKVRIRRGEPDPGVARFGGTPTSFMYEECLRLKGKILEVNWEKDLERMRPTEQAQSLKRGIKYLMLRAINFDERWAGIIGIGFTRAPDNRGLFVEALSLKDRPTRELVQCLKENFEPGGPRATGDTYHERNSEPEGRLATSDTDELVRTTIQRAAESVVNAFMEVVKVVRTLFPRR